MSSARLNWRPHRPKERVQSVRDALGGHLASMLELEAGDGWIALLPEMTEAIAWLKGVAAAGAPEVALAAEDLLGNIYEFGGVDLRIEPRGC